MTKSKIVFKITKGVIFTVTLVIVLILSTFILSRLFNKNNYSKVFGYSLFEVTSNSMYPKLETGDLILVKERKNNDYQVGMIITYQPKMGTKPVTHEIIGRDGDVIITKGIDNDYNDDPINVDDIIGEVVNIYEGYGKVEKFIQNPIGLAMIFIGGLLIFEVINLLERKINKE